MTPKEEYEDAGRRLASALAQFFYLAVKYDVGEHAKDHVLKAIPVAYDGVVALRKLEKSKKECN